MAFVVFLRASSNRRTTTSHLAVLQMCLEPCLICSENKVSPAAFSTASTTKGIRTLSSGPQMHEPGTTKLSRGAESGIMALGRTKAPVETSRVSGVSGEVGFVVRMTFAKCVGTAILGGLPITSWVYVSSQSHGPVRIRERRTTRHFPSDSFLGRYRGTVKT